MKLVEIKAVEELNYDVCEYILRNRIHDCIIHSSVPEILEGLSFYMTEIGIPWSNEPGATGVSLSRDYDLGILIMHICIVCDSDEEIDLSQEKEGIIFMLRDVEKAKIKSLAADSDLFDLEKVPSHLQNEEIRKMFLKTFMIADTEIDIISPWMNFSVVNAALIDLMRKALNRGVKIRILYGLQSSTDGNNQARSERSDQVAERLRECFSEYGEAFQIVRSNIHYKLVLCDDKYKLEGGFNYLSFTGDYSDPTTRIEGSPFGRDINEIRDLRELYFGREHFGNDYVE